MQLAEEEGVLEAHVENQMLSMNIPASSVVRTLGLCTLEKQPGTSIREGENMPETIQEMKQNLLLENIRGKNMLELSQILKPKFYTASKTVCQGKWQKGSA